MINRYIEETLNLVGMQVHRDETVDACHAEQVCYKFGTDADTRFVLAILTSPSEIWNDSHDATGAGTLGGINHQQQLHQIVAVREGRLYKEHIMATNGLLKRHCKFSIGKV